MNRYKKLAANTAVFAIGTFGSKILMFFLTRLYTANMDTAMFGTKELIENTANFIIPICTFCMADAVLRYGLDRNHDKREIFTSACVVELFGLGAAIVLSPVLQLIPFVKGYTPYLVVYICTSSFRALCSNFVRAKGYVRLFAADGIITTLTLFIYNIIFISVLGWGLKGFLISVILSDFCSGLFLWAIAGLGKYFDMRSLNPDIVRLMIRYSLPLIPTALMWIITGFSDRIFVRYMDGPAGLTGEAASGLYAASSKIPNLVNMVSTIFFQAWNMSAITEHDSKGRSRFYQRVFSAYQSIMFIAAAFLILLVQPLSAMLLHYDTDPEYINAYKYTPVLVLAVLMMCFNQFLSSIYNASQHTKNSFWTSFISTMLNIILNIILIKKYGIMGAVTATFVSYAVCYIIRIFDARRYVYFRVSHMKLIFNMAVLFFMCHIAVSRPSFYLFYLTAITILIMAANFNAILATFKKVLSRK